MSPKSSIKYVSPDLQDATKAFIFALQILLAENELTVPRRVLVDLTRFKSFKRIQRGLEPNSLSMACGAFMLQSLGVLTDKSDLKYVLAPSGFR